jgi:CheY-like chemotaxis protein
MDRILVVDDSQAISSLMRAQLDNLGDLKTESAASLAETKRLLAENPARFMMAVLDLNLPDAPNGEVVDLVRGFDIPVVVRNSSAC